MTRAIYVQYYYSASTRKSEQRVEYSTCIGGSVEELVGGEHIVRFVQVVPERHQLCF